MGFANQCSMDRVFRIRISLHNLLFPSTFARSIEAAYAAHPTPDVFINFASVRSLPSKLWAIIVEGVRKSDTNELISYARSNEKVFIGTTMVCEVQAGAFKIGHIVGTIANIIQCKLYMALLQVAGSHINGWECHASRTKSVVVSAKKSVALYNVFPISAPSNSHPNTRDSNKPNFQHIDMEAQAKAELNKKDQSVVILYLGDKVLREVTGETTAAGVWSKLETLYMTKLLANKLYLKKKLYTFYMPIGRKISEHIDEFNKIVLDLANIEVKFKDEDLALLLLTSLPASYEHFGDTLLYGREALTLMNVMATLNSKEIKERSKAKGDDGEGLYDHLKRNRPKNNRKKSTGYVNKDDQPSSSGLIYDDSEVMMVMSVEALLDWIMDLGGSYHMTPMIDLFFDYLECDGGRVLLGDNKECKIRGIGKVRVQLKDGSSFVLQNVRYIPELKRNLISLGTLKKEGYTVKLHSGKIKVINGSRVVLTGTRRDNYVYSLDGHAVAGELNASVEEKDSLAHVYILKYKHEAFEKFKEWKQLVENQTGRTVKKLRMDNGLEFCNREFKQLCIESGIARHLTVAGTPQQNGLAECMNRTLMDKVRCLLIQFGLPRTLWAEAACTAAYLINRSPSKTIKKKTPIEIWSGHPSDYEMLRTFGCVACSHVKQGKLEPRAVKCVLLGYPEGVNGYKLYRLDDESPKIVTSRNMVFNESFMYKDTLKDSGAGIDKSVEELQVEVQLQGLSNRTPGEDHADQEDGNDENAGEQETDQAPDLTDYQLVRDREPRARTKPLRKGLKVFKGLGTRQGWWLVDSHKGQLEQLDVKTTFLHGNLEEIIYMRQPPGYEQGNKVCLLKKSLYGLKQSPRQWYRRFDEYMLSNEFKRSSYDSCIYYRSYALGKYIYLLLYVDDMLIACKSKAEIGSTMTLLKREFDMKEIGEAKKILGMEIIRDRSHKILMVSQSEYISKILNNFRIDNGKSVQMPLGGHFKLPLKDCPVRDCDVERMSKVPYANAVRSLMYLMVCTRPNIVYAVSIVSRYLVNLGKNCWEAVKWILKYLRGTTKVGLVYGKNNSNHVDVAGFVDSDYAKDPNKGRSITSYTFLVQGCVVSWKATLPHMVALSTTEAEYMALTKAVKEAIWLRGLLKELGVELNRVVVNCDNQGAIHLSQNHVFHERTKHINVRYHFIRKVLEAKMIKVLKVGTEYNAADALTKVRRSIWLDHWLRIFSTGMCCKLEGNATTRGGSFNYKGGVYGSYGSCEGIYLAKGTLGRVRRMGMELNTVAVNCDNQGAIHLSRNHVFHERAKHINVRYHFIREVLKAKTVKVLHNVADALTKVVPGRKLQHCLELLSVGIG
ncbi:copia LTR rider [Tanacetum coccineum]